MTRSRVSARFSARFAAAAAALLFCGAAGAADLIKVNIDEAKVIQLPEQTSTIIIGNPVVADVTMLRKNNRMIITGKSYGQTNLIALDSGGNAIGESVIQVRGSFKGLIVQRGMERESWDCSTRCQPTINLGDAARYANDTAGMIKLHGGLATGK